VLPEVGEKCKGDAGEDGLRAPSLLVLIFRSFGLAGMLDRDCLLGWGLEWTWPARSLFELLRRFDGIAAASESREAELFEGVRRELTPVLLMSNASGRMSLGALERPNPENPLSFGAGAAGGDCSGVLAFWVASSAWEFLRFFSELELFERPKRRVHPFIIFGVV